VTGDRHHREIVQTVFDHARSVAQRVDCYVAGRDPCAFERPLEHLANRGVRLFCLGVSEDPGVKSRSGGEESEVLSETRQGIPTALRRWSAMPETRMSRLTTRIVNAFQTNHATRLYQNVSGGRDRIGPIVFSTSRERNSILAAMNLMPHLMISERAGMTESSAVVNSGSAVRTQHTRSAAVRPRVAHSTAGSGWSTRANAGPTSRTPRSSGVDAASVSIIAVTSVRDSIGSLATLRA
jgi:hypothetical protein